MTEPIVVGGTYNWFLNPARINVEAAPGVYGAWDLTGATVTISFVNPSGVGTSFAATIVSATAGTARYVNQTSLFDVVGKWGVSWRVSKSGTVLESRIVEFEVYASGAAA